MSAVEDKIVHLILEGLYDGEKAYYRDLSVLVMGCAGFIGSWLSETLAYLGSRVICLDNPATGSRDNIARILDKPGFKLVIGCGFLRAQRSL